MNKPFLRSVALLISFSLVADPAACSVFAATPTPARRNPTPFSTALFDSQALDARPVVAFREGLNKLAAWVTHSTPLPEPAEGLIDYLSKPQSSSRKWPWQREFRWDTFKGVKKPWRERFFSIFFSQKIDQHAGSDGERTPPRFAPNFSRFQEEVSARIVAANLPTAVLIRRGPTAERKMIHDAATTLLVIRQETYERGVEAVLAELEDLLTNTIATTPSALQNVRAFPKDMAYANPISPYYWNRYVDSTHPSKLDTEEKRRLISQLLSELYANDPSEHTTALPIQVASLGLFSTVMRAEIDGVSYAVEVPNVIDSPQPGLKSVQNTVASSAANIKTFWNKGRRRFIPELKLFAKANSLPIAIYEYLRGFETLRIKNGALRRTDQDIFIDPQESATILAEIVAAIVYHYDPDLDGGTTITDVSVAAGDFVYRSRPDGSPQVRLTTIRDLQSGVSVPVFIRSLIYLVSYELFHADSTDPRRQFHLHLPVVMSNPSIAFEGLVRGLTYLYTDQDIPDASQNARATAENWLRAFIETPEGQPFREQVELFLNHQLPLQFGQNPQEGQPVFANLKVLYQSAFAEMKEPGSSALKVPEAQYEQLPSLIRNIEARLKTLPSDIARWIRTPDPGSPTPSAMAGETWYARSYLWLRNESQGIWRIPGRILAGVVRVVVPAIAELTYRTPSRLMGAHRRVIVGGQEKAYVKLSLAERQRLKRAFRSIFGPLIQAQRLSNRPLAWTLWTLYLPISILLHMIWHVWLIGYEAAAAVAGAWGYTWPAFAPSAMAMGRRNRNMEKLDRGSELHDELKNIGFTPEQIRLRGEVRSLMQLKVVDTGLDRRLDASNDINDAREFMALASQPLWEGGPSMVGASFPEDLGGSERGFVSESIITEEQARISQSLALIHDVRTALTTGPVLYADREKKQFLDIVKGFIHGDFLGVYGQSEPNAGSDVAYLKTTASRMPDSSQVFKINGEKYYGTVGMAARYAIVFARAPGSDGHRGISTFLVQIRDQDGRPMPGVQIEHMNGMVGHRGTGTAAIRFTNADGLLMGNEGEGFKSAMHTLEHGRISITSIILGSLEATVDEVTVAFRQRLARGMPASERKVWEQELADFRTDAFATRSLLMAAARERDTGASNNFSTALAKLYGGERAVRNAARAIKLIGPDALRVGAPLERIFRDAHLLTIGEGATEVMRQIVLEELKREAKRQSETTGENKDISFVEAVRQHPAARHPVVQPAMEALLAAYETPMTAYARGLFDERIADLLSEGQALWKMQEALREFGHDATADLYLKNASDHASVLASNYAGEVESLLAKTPMDLRSAIDHIDMVPGLDPAVASNMKHLADDAMRLFRPYSAKAGEFLRGVFAVLQRSQYFENVQEQLRTSDEEERQMGVALRQEALGQIAQVDLSIAAAVLEREKAVAVLSRFSPVGPSPLSQDILAGSRSASVAWRDKSSSQAVMAMPIKDGKYVVTGTKSVVVNAPGSDAFIVLAPIAGWQGLSAFLVPNGIFVRVETGGMLGGLRGASIRDVSFDHAPAILLGQVNDGSKVLEIIQQVQDDVLPAIAVGASRATLEAGLKHSETRTTYQKNPDQSRSPAPLLNYPQVREILEQSLERVRAMQEPGRSVDSILTVAAQEISSDILQIHGGAGYDAHGSICERYWRDLQTLSTLYADETERPLQARPWKTPSPRTRKRVTRGFNEHNVTMVNKSFGESLWMIASLEAKHPGRELTAVQFRLDREDQDLDSVTVALHLQILEQLNLIVRRRSGSSLALASSLHPDIRVALQKDPGALDRIIQRGVLQETHVRVLDPERIRDTRQAIRDELGLPPEPLQVAGMMHETPAAKDVFSKATELKELREERKQAVSDLERLKSTSDRGLIRHALEIVAGLDRRIERLETEIRGLLRKQVPEQEQDHFGDIVRMLVEDLANGTLPQMLSELMARTRVHRNQTSWVSKHAGGPLLNLADLTEVVWDEFVHWSVLVDAHKVIVQDTWSYFMGIETYLKDVLDDERRSFVNAHRNHFMMTADARGIEKHRKLNDRTEGFAAMMGTENAESGPGPDVLDEMHPAFARFMADPRTTLRDLYEQARRSDTLTQRLLLSPISMNADQDRMLSELGLTAEESRENWMKDALDMYLFDAVKNPDSIRQIRVEERTITLSLNPPLQVLGGGDHRDIVLQSDAEIDPKSKVGEGKFYGSKRSAVIESIRSGLAIRYRIMTHPVGAIRHHLETPEDVTVCVNKINSSGLAKTENSFWRAWLVSQQEEQERQARGAELRARAALASTPTGVSKKLLAAQRRDQRSARRQATEAAMNQFLDEAKSEVEQLRDHWLTAALRSDPAISRGLRAIESLDFLKSSVEERGMLTLIMSDVDTFIGEMSQLKEVRLGAETPLSVFQAISRLDARAGEFAAWLGYIANELQQDTPVSLDDRLQRILRIGGHHTPDERMLIRLRTRTAARAHFDPRAVLAVYLYAIRMDMAKKRILNRGIQTEALIYADFPEKKISVRSSMIVDRDRSQEKSTPSDRTLSDLRDLRNELVQYGARYESPPALEPVRLFYAELVKELSDIIDAGSQPGTEERLKAFFNDYAAFAWMEDRMGSPGLPRPLPSEARYGVSQIPSMIQTIFDRMGWYKLFARDYLFSEDTQSRRQVDLEERLPVLARQEADLARRIAWSGNDPRERVTLQVKHSNLIEWINTVCVALREGQIAFDPINFLTGSGVMIIAGATWGWGTAILAIGAAVVGLGVLYAVLIAGLIGGQIIYEKLRSLWPAQPSIRRLTWQAA